MKNIKYLLLSALAVWLSFSCKEEYNPTPENNLFVDHNPVSGFEGDEIQLTVSPTEEGYTFFWETDDPEVATVDANGLVTLVGAGATAIIVSNGDADAIIEVSVRKKVLLEDIHLNSDELSLPLGEEFVLVANLIPSNVDDVSLDDLQWESDDPDIAKIDAKGKVTSVSPGNTVITARIGSIEKKIDVEVFEKQSTPFNGPHILTNAATVDNPFIIKAADYDFGGEGYAFHDNDPENIPGSTYRSDHGDLSEGVDVEGDDGHNIGYVNPGEWLMYTIEVQDAGEYLFVFEGAIPGSGGVLHLEVDGEDVTGSVPMPATSGWGDYKIVSSPADQLLIHLEEGTRKLKVYFEGGFNLKRIGFIKN